MSFLALVLTLATRLQDADRLGVPNQIEPEFERRWTALQEASKPKDLLDLYALACETKSNHLMQPDPETLRWIRLPCALAPRLEGLTPRLLEAHEIVAQQAIDGVRDPVLLRRLIERYAYTQAAKRAREALANRAGDEGRLDEALKTWAADFDRNTTPEGAARLAFAHARRGDLPALRALRAAVAGLKDPVRVAGRPRELLDVLDDLLKTIASAETTLPVAPALGNELCLGRYEFKGSSDGYAREQAAALPALGRSGDRDLLLFTNGWRVVALDPARGDGGSLEDAVDWRYPRDSSVRNWTTINAYPGTPPPVGVVIGNGRAFVTMFTRDPERTQQIGRRSDRTEGPAALRAFDLASGELIWDTETLEAATADGSPGRMIAQTDFGRRNFCFAGPPLVRGDRLYAAVITSPATGRFVYVICLDARTGRPIWTSAIAEAPRSPGGTPLAMIAEEAGTLIVCSNFGVLAALDAETGTFEWLVKYRDVNNPDSRLAASPPLIAGSLVYFLAQDVDELLAYDRWTGRSVSLPKPSEPLPWKSFKRLAGRFGDWLVLTGVKNAAYRVSDGQVVSLMDVEGDVVGRAVFSDGRLYIPTRGALQVYEAGNWKLTQALPWSEKQGNLLAADGRIFLQSDQVAMFSTPAALQARFNAKTEAQPPHGPSCRQVAAILEASGRPKEAVSYYRRALKVWDSDPAWRESAEGIRLKLATLAEKLGEDFPKE